MTLDEINKKEKREYEAFKLWTAGWNLNHRQRLDLHCYVEALLCQIADLESDKHVVIEDKK